MRFGLKITRRHRRDELHLISETVPAAMSGLAPTEGPSLLPEPRQIEVQASQQARALSQIAQSLPAQLTEICAKRAMGIWPRAEEGKHLFYVLTFRPGADLARLLPQVDGPAWDDLEDEAKLSAFPVPSNLLLVDAIPRRSQRNDRQQIGSKQRERANTDSRELI